MDERAPSTFSANSVNSRDDMPRTDLEAGDVNTEENAIKGKVRFCAPPLFRGTGFIHDKPLLFERFKITPKKGVDQNGMAFMDYVADGLAFK